MQQRRPTPASAEERARAGIGAEPGAHRKRWEERSRSRRSQPRHVHPAGAGDMWSHPGPETPLSRPATVGSAAGAATGRLKQSAPNTPMVDRSIEGVTGGSKRSVFPEHRRRQTPEGSTRVQNSRAVMVRPAAGDETPMSFAGGGPESFSHTGLSRPPSGRAVSAMHGSMRLSDSLRPQSRESPGRPQSGYASARPRSRDGLSRGFAQTPYEVRARLLLRRRCSQIRMTGFGCCGVQSPGGAVRRTAGAVPKAANWGIDYRGAMNEPQNFTTVVFPSGNPGTPTASMFDAPQSKPSRTRLPRVS